MIQLDESTDVSSNAILLVFVRYIGVTDLEEYLLMLDSLPCFVSNTELTQKQTEQTQNHLGKTYHTQE